MKLGFQQDDVDSSPGQSLDGSFRKCFQQNDINSSPRHSLNGSFRRSKSDISTHRTSNTSASTKSVRNSKKVFKVLKDYARKLIDLDLFTESLEDWVLEKLHGDTTNGGQCFRSPFMIDELRTLDFALEGGGFQQLFRMPCSPYASDDLKEDEYLALEDFLHTMADGLWRTFWHKNRPLPYFVSCPRYPGFKFYTLEKAISRGRLGELCGAALISKTKDNLHVDWDEVVELALFRSGITMGNELGFSSTAICEALFYGVHILLSRSLNKYNAVTSDSVFLLVLDSKFGGVIKLGGDLGKLELNLSNPYQSMVEWLTCHAEVCVSQVDRIWNKLGNANWGDLGTLQLLLATFYSIVQWNGPPRKSIASLASDHSLRLQKRRMELFENENALVPFQHTYHQHGEIVELDQNNNPSSRKQATHLKPKRGDILLLEDQQEGQKSFQIQEFLRGGIHCSYSAVSLDYPNELLNLYVGAHPSRLEPSWEDMSLWYHVQRQTKVLNIFKQHDISNKYLPEIIASGRILHAGPCKKQTPVGLCDHPLCGTPILITYPVGEPLSSAVARDGPFSSGEALRCCRDCLAALRNAKMASVQHGDFCPENIIRVVNITQGAASNFLYIPISWGRAVLEEKDSPAINLQFSSAHALQHGKLCPSSDAESLVYLLYFVCGGTNTMEQLDSIESALQWRQRCWAKRVIQQRLGEVSALLKAFSDYVDSLCGTPYPVDYDIWLKRLNRAVDGSADKAKLNEQVSVLTLKDVAESSGTSSTL